MHERIRTSIRIGAKRGVNIRMGTNLRACIKMLHPGFLVKEKSSSFIFTQLGFSGPKGVLIGLGAVPVARLRRWWLPSTRARVSCMAIAASRVANAAWWARCTGAWTDILLDHARLHERRRGRAGPGGPNRRAQRETGTATGGTSCPTEISECASEVSGLRCG